MSNYKTQNKKIIKFRNYIYLFITVFLIMLLSYKYYGFAPFGKNSLAWKDADIQYLDLFAYFKDVLSGKNSIGYTFSKSLGGSNIAVFTYYLASPLNFLVVFFDKSNLHTFFDIIVAVKLGLAAVTMQVFILGWFHKVELDKIQKRVAYFLSISYALSQYSIAQSSNIMWLDGVYLLPLILLGVHKLIYEKNGVFLSVSVGLSIIFNWYTGGINCLFAIIWWFFEIILYNIEHSSNRWNIKEFVFEIIKYGFSMAMGVCLSAVLFLPTIGALQKNAKGTLDISKLKDLTFTGKIGSVIQAYSVGAQSEYGKVSLFCGSIVIIGCISLFLAKSIIPQIKIWFGALITIIVLLFYWKPLFNIFSLFRSADSYWYRYSYVGIVALIFVAAYFYLQYIYREQWIIIIKSGVSFAIILLVLNGVNAVENTNYVQFTALFLVLICFVLGNCFNGGTNKKILIISLSILVVFELFIEVRLEMENYHVSNVDIFKKYSTDAELQINKIKQQDDDLYRISQTSTRNADENTKITANYNEALAYNYWGIPNYLSSPDDVSREFLDLAGYRSEADCMNIVNTSIIGIDSLVGTKYVLSSYDINGYEKQENMGVYNGKYVYKNPYAVPIAFTYDANSKLKEIDDPFEYQNWIYSCLIGEETNIYIPLDFSERTENNGEKTYVLNTLVGKYAYYGNIPWKSWMNAAIEVNGVYEMAYSCWLSPSVFYIPSENKDTIQIVISTEDLSGFCFEEAQFYALDLEKLSEVTKKMQENKVNNLEMKNGRVCINTNVGVSKNVFISIPYDEGWKIKVNGIEIEPDLLADCFYSIHVEAGYNEIIMEYKILYKSEGIIVSIIGVFGIVFMEIIIKRNRIQRKMI